VMRGESRWLRYCVLETSRSKSTFRSFCRRHDMSRHRREVGKVEELAWPCALWAVEIYTKVLPSRLGRCLEKHLPQVRSLALALALALQGTIMSRSQRAFLSPVDALDSRGRTTASRCSSQDIPSDQLRYEHTSRASLRTFPTPISHPALPLCRHVLFQYGAPLFFFCHDYSSPLIGTVSTPCKCGGSSPGRNGP
jgi:hypothetical protein